MVVLEERRVPTIRKGLIQNPKTEAVRGKKYISSKAPSLVLPDLSCLILPLLVLGSMGRKSLNQVISGSGLPLAAQSMVAVRVRSTTFSCGPMSMLGNPPGSRSSVGENTDKFKDKQ